MTYDELVTAVENTTENSYDKSDMDRFIQTAEKSIYNMVQPPSLRKNQTGSMTAGNRFLTTPSDFISPFSLAVISATGDTTYLLNKDVEFLREAYPNTSTSGVPQYYAMFDADSMIVAPTPSLGFTVEIHYFAYPESIVTSGRTWLGDVFDVALMNGALCEAIRFMKGEQDMVALYESKFKESVSLLKNLSDGKLQQDTYRTNQARVKVQ